MEDKTFQEHRRWT